jgi:RND family efflux transporter MFP subunit
MINEEEEKIVAENEPSPAVEASPVRTGFNNKKLIVSLVIILGLLVLAVVFWIWQRERGDAGQAVPAPRHTSFDESNKTANSLSETTLTLSPEQAQRAGIKTETVGEKFSEAMVSSASTGVVQANQYRATPVMSLTGGVVRQINAELGKQVSRGEALAVIFSEDLANTESRYLTLQKEVETARQNYQRESKLVGISPVSNAELDEAKKKLQTADAELEEHHKHHERITKLVAIGAASREELEQAITKIKTAEAELEEAKRRYDRAVQIAQINPVSRASFEQSAVKLRTMETELASVRERLRLLGLSTSKIDSLRSASQISSELILTAPVSGTVTSRSVNLNEVIEPNKELMRVTDLSSVWVIAQIYEKDLGLVRTGSGATVTTNSFPDRVFRGQVSYLDPNLNQETRTAQARIELGNPGQILKLGMYVNVAFGSAGMAEKTMPAVPSAAVQNINNQQVVFVSTDQPNIFVMKPVRLVPESEGFYPVLEGITVGERVVTEGSFLLRAEWLKVHPAGQ